MFKASDKQSNYNRLRTKNGITDIHDLSDAQLGRFIEQMLRRCNTGASCYLSVRKRTQAKAEVQLMRLAAHELLERMRGSLDAGILEGTKS